MSQAPDPVESPRRFYVRTYGCQMNEHDSERIAGLLASEGMEATDDLESADVVVLNTCCIRENADNKLYGHLGPLTDTTVQITDAEGPHTSLSRENVKQIRLALQPSAPAGK